MNHGIFKLSNALAVSCLLTLTACGGGGGDGGGDSVRQTGEFDGNTEAATITEQNVQDLSIASAEGALHTAKSGSGSVADFPFGVSASFEDGILARANSMPANLPVGVSLDETDNCFVSGTERWIADFDISDNNGENFTGSFVYIYDNCQESANYIQNGRIESEFAADGSYTVTFVDYSLTINGITQTYRNTTVYCDRLYNCVYNDDFVGVSGGSYRVSDTSVSGDNNSGFNMTGRIYHDTYGYVDFQASNFTYCANGYPGSGTIAMTAQGITAYIEFFDCNSFVYTLNGVAWTYDW